MITGATVDISYYYIYDLFKCIYEIQYTICYPVSINLIIVVVLLIMSIRMMDLLTLNADEPSSNGTKSQEVNTESKENHDESKEENDKSEQSKHVSKVDKSKKGKGKKAAQPKPYVIVPEVSHTEFEGSQHGPPRPPIKRGSDPLPYFPPAHIIKDLNDKLNDGTISQEQFANELNKLFNK